MKLEMTDLHFIIACKCYYNLTNLDAQENEKFLHSASYTINILETTNFFFCNLSSRLFQPFSELLFLCFLYHLLLVSLFTFLLLWNLLSIPGNSIFY